MEVYVDESGDLGFGRKASRFFIVAYLFMKESKQFKESFKWFHLRQKRKEGYHLDELKFSQSKDSIRKQGLRLICNTPACSYGIIAVNKRKIKKSSTFYRDSEGIYRYIIVSTVMNAIVPRLKPREELKTKKTGYLLFLSKFLWIQKNTTRPLRFELRFAS